MRLHIQNINKIKEADIALNGLTVIVGENDMGKSTIGRAFFSTITVKPFKDISASLILLIF